MSAPNTPTNDEVSRAMLYWEYDQQVIDVSTMEDPPGSRPPIVNIRRRIVGEWEYYAEKDYNEEATR